jgi:N-acetylglutamate synthase-like GNAT family acetyltransferase
VRRATLDDLPALRTLWTNFGLPLDVLEKRFTEVQVAENGEGQIVGALGLKVERLHGQIHSEVIPGAESAAIYEAFWQRLQILGRNYGLFRLWTDSTSPFWQTLGFKKVEGKALEKAPASFGSKEKLLSLALKEESADGISVEQQFEIFTQAQKRETEQLLQQAQTLKKVAYTILALLVGGLLAAAVVRFFMSPGIRRKLGQ